MKGQPKIAMPESPSLSSFRQEPIGQILRHHRQLSERQLARLHRHYNSRLIRFAVALGAPDPEAAANDGFLDGIRAHGRGTVTDERAFLAYLYRATRSHVISQCRRRRATPSEIGEADLVTETRADEVIDRLWLATILEQLTDDQRRVLDLRVVQGLTAREAGRRLGRNANAVYQLQHRAESRLRHLVRAAS